MPMTSRRCGRPVLVERLAELPGELPVQEVEREVGRDVGELVIVSTTSDNGARPPMSRTIRVAMTRCRNCRRQRLSSSSDSGAAAVRKAPMRAAVSGRSAWSSSQTPTCGRAASN
jgi:hypothetical protein